LLITYIAKLLTYVAKSLTYVARDSYPLGRLYLCTKFSDPSGMRLEQSGFIVVAWSDVGISPLFTYDRMNITKPTLHDTANALHGKFDSKAI
jgi:hypothetical protein